MNVKVVVPIVLALVFVSSSAARGQNTSRPAPPTTAPRALADATAAVAASTAPAAGGDAQDMHPVGDRAAFTPEELEQMLAAVALYPDALLTQIFMASTYPIEIVEADRWLKKNSKLKGEALAKELEKQPWDPSVRSLVNFPDVLAMMSEQIGTTLKIGDAFIGQQKDVMDAVQRLRAKAKKEGNLATSEQMKVSTQTADTGSEVIIIESSSPDVIYVPSYDPVYVYGGWPYPSYPPYPYYPYPVVNPLLSFGVGVACGVAWGYAWGNCNWGSGDVDIDIDRNVNFNGNIDREKFKQNQADRQGNRDTRQTDRQGNRDTRQGDRQGGQGKWQHDTSHRQGVSYRNQDAASKVGAGTASNRATQARNDYRGKAETGRRDIAGGAADSARGGASGARPGNTGAAGSRAPSSMNRSPNQAPSSMNRGGAPNGSRNSGSDARASSSRGSSSRSASPSRSSGSRSSGGSRGGGSRGGGGRGGGRR